MANNEGKKKVINCETGEITYEDYSNEEIAEQLSKGEEINKLIESKKQAITQRIALLNKLGISEEEAKFLLS
jgi:hypothetical protein